MHEFNAVKRKLILIFYFFVISMNIHDLKKLSNLNNLNKIWDKQKEKADKDRKKRRLLF